MPSEGGGSKKGIGSNRAGAPVLRLEVRQVFYQLSAPGLRALRNRCDKKMPANRHKPILMVDVDGVISLYGFPFGAQPAGTFVTVDGMVHFISAEAGDHLRGLARSFQLIWCTGWEERAAEYLPHVLGLSREIPHLRLDAGAGMASKRAAIDAFAGPGRAVAWIDDSHTEACAAWAARRPGPTLLVATAPPRGLTDTEADALAAWAAGLARA
jgi:hypothetical protein